MSFFTALVSLLNGVMTLLGHFGIGSKKTTASAATVAVKTANDMAKASAQAAIETQTSTDKEIANAQAETASDIARVHDADSLRDVAAAVQDAIERANQQSGAARH